MKVIFSSTPKINGIHSVTKNIPHLFEFLFLKGKDSMKDAHVGSFVNLLFISAFLLYLSPFLLMRKFWKLNSLLSICFPPELDNIGDT